jgi:uncharacterized protein (TIGR00725 family)
VSMPIIGVMGPGNQASAEELQTAYQLGREIAQAGWVLLTGGRNQGVMDAASRGAKSANGLTVGILPGSDRHGISTAIDIPIFTDLGNARNNINVLSSDVVIACGMGAGTASEVALAIKANKPVILLRVNVESQVFFHRLASKQVFTTENVEGAIALIQQQLRQSENQQDL